MSDTDTELSTDAPAGPDVESAADELSAALDSVADAIGADDGGVDPAAVDALLDQATFDDVGNPAEPPAPGTERPTLPDFNKVLDQVQASSIDMLRDVDLDVTIELGRSRMMVEDVLRLGEGCVVELDKLAGDPVDVYVNDRLVARGEVLVLNDNFCVRVNEIVNVPTPEAA
jgi:flagellar motor switch protein FliN/FliY